MIEYLVIIALLIYGIVKFDFKGNTDTNDRFYKAVFVLMVLMSGLAFRMGADLVDYEDAFYSDYNIKIGGIDRSFFVLDRMQPGWKLLSIIVYNTTHSFIFFKLIQAFFFHFALFKLINGHTEYRYVVLLLYFILLFPHINFNVLRESFAIAFFLLSVPSFEKGNWKNYYLLTFCAIMFHTGAIAFLFLPLANIIKFKSAKRTILIAFVFFIAAYFLSFTNISDTLFSFMMITGSEHLEDQAMIYLYGDKYSARTAINILKLGMFTAIDMLPIIYLSTKNKHVDNKLVILSFVSVLLTLLKHYLPILYRFNDYFTPIWYICVSLFIGEFVKGNRYKQKSLTALVLILLYLYPARSYFGVNQYYNEPLYVQYYPYYSVIHKGYSPVRERLFN